MNRHEEFYALLMLLVEQFYLRKYSTSVPRLEAQLFIQPSLDASFAENFYGLKRRRRPYIETGKTLVAVGGIPKQEHLRDQDIVRSLIFLVRLPFAY